MKPNRLLWILSFAQFLAMQVWFNFSAVMPVLENEWGLTAGDACEQLICSSVLALPVLLVWAG
jgi:nitrate/nitrite transporter NarK